jgi:serine/threonine protein phosphatase PrpC
MNQDKYGITLNFAGEAGDAMFAVYDGHGKDGHSAATFTKKKLPQILAKYIRQTRVQKYMAQLKAEGKTTKGAWNPQKWPFLESSEVERCCQQTFVETNQLMHVEKSVSKMMRACVHQPCSICVFPDGWFPLCVHSLTTSYVVPLLRLSLSMREE